MKYILIFAAVFLASATACGQSRTPQTTTTITTNAQWELPQLPAQLYFAGERVPLENFDTRESLQREMLITTNMHSRTFLALINSKRYFAVIEPILARYGIPADFKYLCVAESGLDPNIVSSAKAAGLWQIMPGTGRDYGLDVGSEVDERYDIEKATEVACRHLLKSKEKFGTWTMAAAAYNLGDNGVGKRIESQTGLDDYYDIWLPDETRRYIFRILSFKVLFENPATYGYSIGEERFYKPLTDYRTVTTCEKDIKWAEFAAKYGTTYKMLRELNHWIRDYSYANKSGKTLTVRIPNKGFRNCE